MSDILSQEEIDALLMDDSQEESLTSEEIDALGEIGNISMGTAATTLFSLLKKKVTITTPNVSITTIKELSELYQRPFVAVEIEYTEGLKGKNLLIVKDRDVKVITDLIMGGDGTGIDDDPLSELHLSAIGEVMNQMIGSSCTSLATMFNKSINISPPNSSIINFTDNSIDLFNSEDKLVMIRFNMEVGDVINSYIMQLLPINFAKELLDNLVNTDEEIVTSQEAEQTENSNNSTINNTINNSSEEFISNTNRKQNIKENVDVHPVSFSQLNENVIDINKRNIDLILDVSLSVSVELGKTKKSIKEILELNSGSVVELDKMAGEPVDILVNGKAIAKGEVVVIDDNFGVRITEIISPKQRISNLK